MLLQFYSIGVKSENHFSGVRLRHSVILLTSHFSLPGETFAQPGENRHCLQFVEKSLPNSKKILFENDGLKTEVA